MYFILTDCLRVLLSLSEFSEAVYEVRSSHAGYRIDAEVNDLDEG